MSADAEPSSDGAGGPVGAARRMMARGDLDGAWTALRRIADAGRPEAAAPVFYELGKLLRGNDPSRARTAFEAAYAAGDDRTVALSAIRLAMLAKAAGEIDRAQAYYEQAVRCGIAGVAGTAAFNLGLLFRQAGDTERAELWYREALSDEYVEVSAKAALGLALLREAAGDLDSARDLLRQAMETGRDEIPSQAAHVLGELLWREGSTAQAEAVLWRAVRAGRGPASLSLGRLLIAEGRPAEAEAVLRDAADRYGDAAVFLALGDLLVRRIDQGADMAQVIASPGLENFVHGYGSHLPAGPEVEEAEQRYRQAVAAGEHSALVRLGHLLIGTGRVPEAERVLREAVEAGAADAEAVLATSLHLRGEDAQAARVLEPAIAAGNARALIVRADLYGHEGRDAEAADVLRRAISAGGARFGAAVFLFIHLVRLDDLDAAAGTLREMLATHDQFSLGLLEAFVVDEPPLTDLLRQARASTAGDAIRLFTEGFAAAVRD